MDQPLLSFVTAAEQKNFTRAAKVLHTTQPAISQHIQSLERRLNVKLLDRSNKYVRLNKAGEAVYHYAKEILQLYTQMERIVDDMINEVRGSLSIGASYTYGEYLLPHAIARFVELYPDVTPIISIENTSQVVERVAAGELDLGVIEGNHSNDHVDTIVLTQDTVAVVASSQHPLVHEVTVSAEQLSQEHWIVRELGSGTREITEQVFRTFHIQPMAMMEFGSTQLIKESVEAGLGVTILSKSAIRKELALGVLAEIPFGHGPIHRPFSLITQKHDFRTKAARLFTEFLRARPDRAAQVEATTS